MSHGTSSPVATSRTEPRAGGVCADAWLGLVAAGVVEGVEGAVTLRPTGSSPQPAASGLSAQARSRTGRRDRMPPSWSHASAPRPASLGAPERQPRNWLPAEKKANQMPTARNARPTATTSTLSSIVGCSSSPPPRTERSHRAAAIFVSDACPK